MTLKPRTSDTRASRRLWLLGALRVEGPGGAIRIPGGKAQSLLAFLALHPAPAHTREVLADRLWPDAPPDRVRRNLSDVLYRLRRALGPDWFVVEGEQVALKREPDLWVDVWAFEELCTAGDPESFQKAVALYSGDLLPEIYDDWVLVRRVSLQEQYLSCLLHLGQNAEGNGLFELAHANYRRLADVDPLREEAHRGVMRSLASLGRLVEALAVYNELERLLEAELGVPPAQETQALVDILRSELDQRKHAPAPFVGRAVERAQLLSHLDQARTGHGGLVVVLGEAGIGKTRLLEELARAASWRGWQVVWGQGQELGIPAPHSPLRQALDAALPEPRLRQLAQLVQPLWLNIVAGLVPRITEVLAQPEQPASLPEQNLLPSALRHVLGGLCQITPYLIILEDLQWADPALWPLLDAFHEFLADRALLLVVSGREEELRTQPVIWSFLESWDRSGGTMIHLDGLSAGELAELMAAYGSEKLTPTQSSQLIATSGGNPLLALALLETKDPESLVESPTLAEVMAQRLMTVSQGAKEALEAAAVLGYRFRYLWWEATLQKETRMPILAGELEGAGLIALETIGYRFAHDTLRAYVYANIAPDRRCELHRRALAALRRHAPQETLDLLYHSEQAGDRSSIAQYALHAGEQAMTAWTLPAAVRYFSQALDALPPNDLIQRYTALLGRESALNVLAEREAQRRDLSSLQELVDRLGDVHRQAQVTQRQADLAWVTGDQVEARALAERGLRLARQTGDVALQASLLQTLGRIARYQGDHHQAHKWVLQAHSRFRQAGDRFGEASTLDKLANLAFETGDYQKAAGQHTRAAEIFRELGAIVHEARALNGLGLALRRSGQYARAQEIHQRALTIARESGDKHGEWVELASLGGIAYELGDYATAVEQYASALRLCQAIDLPRGTSMMHNNLGYAYRGLGQWDLALSHFSEALEINRAKGYRGGEAYTQKGRGLTLLDAERYDQARAALKSAQEIWVELGDRINRVETAAAMALAHLATTDPKQALNCARQALEGLDDQNDAAALRQWVHYAIYRIYEAQGQAGQHHLCQAQAAMLEIAASLPPGARKRFLKAVPLNRRTQAALDALTRKRQFQLVRADVPLGRKLADGDYLPITWTIYAPEDDLIQKKTDRRRHVLKRLLTEAQTQGAAPTDKDLATALGVSRRTVLRDMESLAQSGLELPTRRRK